MIVGVFPAFSPTTYGGLEGSASIVSQAIQSVNGPAPAPAPHSFCYGPGIPGDPSLESSHIAHASSRSAAVWTILRQKWTAEILLVWHIHFLKLVPFFRLPAAKVVLFLHGIEAWRKQGWLTRRMLQRVDLILSNSQYTWDHFSEIHPGLAGKRHKVVHLGLGEPLVGPAPLPAADRPIALMLGRMERHESYKGHREMIQAWSLVMQRVPGAELWIVGGGNLCGDLEKVARESGAHGHIRFFGKVSEEKKHELIGQCRCLVLPSRSEGFGLVYLEAMRMGRPCLVSTEDAGREVVNPPEAGMSASPRSARELADATCRLLTLGPDWEQWADRARRRYESRFTAASFQKRLLAALVELG